MVRWILGGIAVLVLGGGVMLYAHAQYLKSPQYSFDQINQALATHDLPLFQSYADVDALSEHVASVILSVSLPTGGISITGGQGGSNGGGGGGVNINTNGNGGIAISGGQGGSSGGGGGGVFISGLLAGAKGQVAIKTKSRLISIVQDGINGDKNVPGTLADFFSINGITLAYSGTSGVTVHGDNATIKASFSAKSSSTPIVLDIAMTRNGQRWKVVDLPNLSDVLKQVQGLSTK